MGDFKPQFYHSSIHLEFITFNVTFHHDCVQPTAPKLPMMLFFPQLVGRGSGYCYYVGKFAFRTF